MWTGRVGDLAHQFDDRLHGRADDDQIGFGNAPRKIAGSPHDCASPFGGTQIFRLAIDPHHLFGQRPRTDRLPDRATDQADAQEGDVFENGFGGHGIGQRKEPFEPAMLPYRLTFVGDTAPIGRRGRPAECFPVAVRIRMIPDNRAAFWERKSTHRCRRSQKSN